MKHFELDQALRTIRSEQSFLVPDMVISKIEDTLSSLPDRAKMARKALRIRRLIYIGASVAMVGFVLVSAVVFSPKAASELNQLPVAGPIIQTVGNWGSEMAAENGLAKQHVTDQGVTMTINKVIYDGLRMSMDYTLYGTVASQKSDMDIEMKVDDVIIGAVQSDHTVNGSVNNVINSGNDANHYVGNIQSILYNYRPPSFDLKLVITRIGDKFGNWSFQFPVEETSNVEVFKPKLSRSKDAMSVKIDEITFSPLSTVVNMDYSFENMKKSYELGFDIIDDKGKIYNPWTYGSQMRNNSQNKSHGNVKMDIPAVQDGVQYLIVKPYFYDINFYSGPNVFDGSPDSLTREPLNVLPTENKPLILSQGQAGRLLITGIEFEADKTVVHYRTEGTNPQVQQRYLYIENEQGELIYPTGETSSTSKQEQIKEFSALSPDSKLSFVTGPIIGLIPIPEMELRIDLPQP